MVGCLEDQYRGPWSHNIYLERDRDLKSANGGCGGLEVDWSCRPQLVSEKGVMTGEIGNFTYAQRGKWW